jgi:Domain of unknown function (DUF4266)
VLGSPCSSRRLPPRAGRLIAGALLAALSVLAGCATVRPEQKEYLAEPAMTWGSEGTVRVHEAHVIDNREGSIGGGAEGGGCGCN